MVTCTDCRDLLWDYEFGLLDTDESLAVKAHLVDCPVCQGELDQVQGDRRRLRAAAVLDVVIPPFVPPVEESPTLPMQTPSRANRPAARPRYWRWLPAAAAVVFLAVLPYGLYRVGLSRHQAAAEAAQQHLNELVARRQETRTQAENEQHELIAFGHARFVRLQVLAPTRFQVGTRNPVRVLTTDLDDKPVHAQVAVRLLDPEGHVLVEKKDLQSTGNLLVDLPGELPAKDLSAVRLDVVAQSSDDRAEVQEPLPIGRPSYLTHVQFAKPIFRPGEMVFFRTLTLDSYRLQPPEKPLNLTYLVTPPGEKSWANRVWSTEGLTLDGGIGGGQFVMPATRPDGEYTLAITEAENRIPRVEHKFVVRRDPPTRLRKTLTFDRTSYKAGDTVRAQLHVEGLEKGVSPADLPVRATLDVDGKPVGGEAQQLQTDAQGSVAIVFALPSATQTGAAFLRIQVGDGRHTESYVRAIPLVAPRLSVQLFPEGGDLLADMPNRVYFRVRTPCNQPASFSGRIVDRQGREVAVLTTVSAAGLGAFTFTPRSDETYTVRSNDPALTVESPGLPAVRSGTVSLSVPTAVTRGSEPVRVVLRNGGPERPLLVGLFCRNRLVAHQQVILKTGSTEVPLAPPPDAAGVLRLTVFDPDSHHPRPVAERLIYRQPATGLQLTVKTDKDRYQAGERVRLELQSRTESGATEPTWLLVAVVNEDAFLVDDRLERQMPAHFYVLNELRRPEDLERGDLFAADTAEAHMAVDLFLGTQGWRRIADASRNAGAPRQADDAGILLLDNEPRARQKFGEALAALDQKLTADDAALAEEADAQAAEIKAAGAALVSFHDWTQRTVRLTGTVGVLLALVVGCGLMLRAVLHRAGRFAATPSFAGAFATLLLCLFGVWALTGIVEAPWDRMPSFPPLAKGSQNPWRQRANALPELAWAPSSDAPVPSRPALASRRWYEQISKLDHPVAGTAGKGPSNSQVPHILILRAVRPQPVKGELDVRQYASLWPKDSQEACVWTPDIALWHPMLCTVGGAAQVEFNVPGNAAHFRILVHGHTASGRLGAVEGKLDIKPEPRGEVR